MKISLYTSLSTSQVDSTEPGHHLQNGRRKFRQARIRKECGPGTDPKLRHNLRPLFTAGRLYLDDELRLRFVSGPGRSGNQIHLVIDPKRVKPYVSLNPLFL
jgi:hypothetical protein